MNIIKHKNIFLIISSLLTIAAIICMVVFGFKLGIDFKGGTSIEVSWDNGNRPAAVQIIETAKTVPNSPEILVQPLGEKSYVLKMREVSPEERESITNIIGKAYPGMSVVSYTSIGPSVGAELLRKSIISIILVSLGIVLFIAFSFRKVSYPVSSWKYGITAIITLLHDVIIPTGIFVVLSKIYNVEVDTLFVVSLLTILGLSVSDTIVVFDRIRENLRTNKSNISFAGVVNKSVNEVYQRSIATSFMVIVALVALAIFGPESTRLLAIMLTAGMFFGTYSSIFLASPFLVTWYEWAEKRKLKKA